MIYFQGSAAVPKSDALLYDYVEARLPAEVLPLFQEAQHFIQPEFFGSPDLQIKREILQSLIHRRMGRRRASPVRRPVLLPQRRERWAWEPPRGNVYTSGGLRASAHPPMEAAIPTLWGAQGCIVLEDMSAFVRDMVQ